MSMVKADKGWYAAILTEDDLVEIWPVVAWAQEEEDNEEGGTFTRYQAIVVPAGDSGPGTIGDSLCDDDKLVGLISPESSVSEWVEMNLELKGKKIIRV